MSDCPACCEIVEENSEQEEPLLWLSVALTRQEWLDGLGWLLDEAPSDGPGRVLLNALSMPGICREK